MQTTEVGRAVIYMRVSSWGQVGKDHVSLDVQEQTTRDYVARHGGTVVAVLRDEAKSGRDVDNPEYLRMLAMVQGGGVDTVVVYMLDRIGRDEAEYFALMKRLDAYGAKLRSATQDLENRLFAGMLMLMAADESRKISQRVVPAQRARLDSGRWIGRAPLGYRIVAHPQGGRRLEPDPDTAWKVERLFELYATGEVGLTKLTQEAAVLGLGGGQSKSNLSRMLTNMTYVGKLVWGRRKKVADATGKRHLNLQRKADWVVRDGDHVAIVDQDTFDRVQAVLAKNQAAKAPRAPQRQLLVGRIFCKCGGRIQGVVNGDSAFYYCPRRRDRNACDQRFVATWKLDNQVTGTIEDVLGPAFDPARRDAWLSELRNLGDEALDAAQQRAKALEASKQRLEGARLNGVDLVARGVIDADLFAAQDARYKAQLAAVEAEIAEVGDVRPAPNYDVALALIESIQDLKNLTKEGWREVIAALIERVDVVDEAVQELTFRPDCLPMVMAAAKVKAYA